MQIIPGEGQVSATPRVVPVNPFWVGTRVGLIKSVKIAVGSVETKKLVLLDFLLKCVNKVFESIGCVKQTNKQASKNPALFVLGPCHLFY